MNPSSSQAEFAQQGKDRGSRRKAMEGGAVFWSVVALVAIKVLWGYWDRDLTFGDTSSYFLEAVLWHQKQLVNLVWSPLYTAYFGSWLYVSENAATVVFLHRMGLIFVLTLLIGWLGVRTLPRLFALILTCWWLALPIHYDTLYEAHLFGAIPLLVLALEALLLEEDWRLPVLIGTAVLATILIRNEYILAVGIFLVAGVMRVIKLGPAAASAGLRKGIFRGVAVLLVVGASVTYFYSASYIRATEFKAASEPKHTLNMCQVYAFGYQQREPAWKASPWTECSGLMQTQFGSPLPSLRQMIVANPGEVLRHFWWNISLTGAGLEVLLFNATSSDVNPDYAPVETYPVVPSVLLGLSVLIVVIGLPLIFRSKRIEDVEIRQNIVRLAPVLSAALIVAFAVVLTQRPRPSYLLGAGVLYMWLVTSCLTAMTWRFKKIHSHYFFLIFSAFLLWAIPSYRQLDLPSKRPQIKFLYGELLPNQSRLCRDNGKIALENYLSEIVNYLCAPLGYPRRSTSVQAFQIASLELQRFANPESFVSGLEMVGATAVVIDPFFLPNHPDMQSCAAVRDEFIKRGWEQLSYLVQDGGKCVASYARKERDQRE